MSMTVTCYGPRGSTPSPSRKGRNGKPDFITSEYGGNTSCYLVQAGPFNIILDMGSGVSIAGDDLLRAGKGVNTPFIVLLSHFHWDHIQGGPFSIPLFIGSNHFHFHGFAPAGTESTVPFEDIVRDVIAKQQEAPNFPISHQAMPAQKAYHTHQPQSSETFKYYWEEVEGRPNGRVVFNATEVGGSPHETLPDNVRNEPRRWIKITTIPLAHPNFCLGYKIEYMGSTLVYCTDNEPWMFLNAQITKHAKDADWLLLDGQYTPAQLSGVTQGFGHGTPRNCVEQAMVCGAKRCVIHHHDPRHDDTKVGEMEQDAIRYGKELGYEGVVEFAKEGTVWEI